MHLASPRRSMAAPAALAVTAVPAAALGRQTGWVYPLVLEPPARVAWVPKHDWALLLAQRSAAEPSGPDSVSASPAAFTVADRSPPRAKSTVSDPVAWDCVNGDTVKPCSNPAGPGLRSKANPKLFPQNIQKFFIGIRRFPCCHSRRFGHIGDAVILDGVLRIRSIAE